MVARDGRLVWVHDETVPIRDESGELVAVFYQGAMYDVTKPKRASRSWRRPSTWSARTVEPLREADN